MLNKSDNSNTATAWTETIFQTQFWSNLFWWIQAYYVLTHTVAHRKIVNWKKALHSQLKHLLTYLKFLKTHLAYIRVKKKKASVSQTDGHLTPLFSIWSLYESDTVAESFAH